MENIFIKGYRSYMKICEEYGMESVSFIKFIDQLTESQIEEYSKLSN